MYTKKVHSACCIRRYCLFTFSHRWSLTISQLTDDGHLNWLPLTYPTPVPWGIEGSLSSYAYGRWLSWVSPISAGGVVIHLTSPPLKSISHLRWPHALRVKLLCIQTTRFRTERNRLVTQNKQLRSLEISFPDTGKHVCAFSLFVYQQFYIPDMYRIFLLLGLELCDLTLTFRVWLVS